MPKTPPYSKEFRAEAVRLLRSSGRPIPQVARELGCSEQSLRNWSRQVDVDAGEAEGLTTDEREELRRLRRENLILAEERDILKKQRPSSPRTARPGEDLRVHRGEEGRALDRVDVPGPGRESVGVSCLADAQTVSASARGSALDRPDRRDPPALPARLRIAAYPRRARARRRRAARAQARRAADARGGHQRHGPAPAWT